MEGVPVGVLRPTPIGLRLLDQCPYRFGDPRNVAAPEDLELAGIFVDREDRLAALASGDKFVDGVVESGAKVLYRLPCQQWPVVGLGLPPCCERATCELLRGTTLTLGREFVDLSILEGRGFVAESVDLFYAPLEFAACR